MCCFGFQRGQNSPSVHGFQDNPKRLKMSNSKILAEKLGQPTSASIFVQHKIDLKNPPHGFCAWLSKLSRMQTIFGNSKWFRSWAWIFKPLNQNCNNFQNFGISSVFGKFVSWDLGFGFIHLAMGFMYK